MSYDSDYDDTHLCDYCGDEETSSKYCSGWCRYRAEERAPMKRETMKRIINHPRFEEIMNKINEEKKEEIK